MVGVVELESTTSTMSTWRSNQLSYTPTKSGLCYLLQLLHLTCHLIYHLKIIFQAHFKKKSQLFLTFLK